MASTGSGVLTTSDRDQVLRAMADCCAKDGYRQVRVEAVLERAEVGPETFEALFADKEDCALAAINRLVSEALSRVSLAEAGRPGGSDEQRHAEVRAIVELMTSLPSFTRLMLIDARQGATPRMRGAYVSAFRILALMLVRSCQAEDGADAARLARTALGSAEALIRRELTAGRESDLPRLTGDLVYAALVPLTGQREALRQAKLAAGTGTKGV